MSQVPAATPSFTEPTTKQDGGETIIVCGTSRMGLKDGDVIKTKRVRNRFGQLLEIQVNGDFPSIEAAVSEPRHQTSLYTFRGPGLRQPAAKSG